MDRWPSHIGSAIAPLACTYDGPRPLDPPQPEDSDISIAGMSQADKNAIWRHIKQHHPERVAFLTDPTVQQMMKEMGASPVFPRELIREALRNRNVNKDPA